MNIPIRNVYYLLCYAWNHVDQQDLVSRQELDEFERVQDLLGSVLARGTFQLVRRGLDRGYRETREDSSRVRGKIAMGETVSRTLKARAQVACVFEELSHDILHNRVLRSTLRNLLGVSDLASGVREQVGLAFRKLEGISSERLTSRTFRRIQLDRNRRSYRFLIGLCELVYNSILINDEDGRTVFIDFRQDEQRMWKVFEDFVSEFYRREQAEYDVTAQAELGWHDAGSARDSDLARVPKMYPDLVLEGPHRRIILDTKFYSNPLSGEGGHIWSGNLYQLLAYLRNRQAHSPDGPQHEGVLLYPVVDDSFAIDVRLEGFRIQARSIDLRRRWEGVHRELVDLISHGTAAKKAARGGAWPE